jgi:hypothetical protein
MDLETICYAHGDRCGSDCRFRVPNPRCWKCGGVGPFDMHFVGRDSTQKMCMRCFEERAALHQKARVKGDI